MDGKTDADIGFYTLNIGKNITVGGVVKVEYVTDKEVLFKLKKGSMALHGADFNVEKLDTATGAVALSGTVYRIQIGKGGTKEPLLKRLLK